MMNIEGQLHQHRLLKKKIRGNGTLIYALVSFVLLSMCMYVSFMFISIRDKAKGVDNSVTTSIIGSARINMQEYGTTNQIVIHESLSDKYIATLGNHTGTRTELYIPNNVEYFSPNPAYDVEFAVSYSNADYNLEWSKNKFIELLKLNLELDDNMVPKSNSANGKILKPTYYNETTNQDEENKVVVEEYTVINKYTYRESVAPYNKHTYTVVYRSLNGGAFNVIPSLSGIDKVTYVENGSDGWESIVENGKCDGITINETSVYARISFYTDLGANEVGERQSKKQVVDRIVTVKENN